MVKYSMTNYHQVPHSHSDRAEPIVPVEWLAVSGVLLFSVSEVKKTCVCERIESMAVCTIDYKKPSHLSISQVSSSVRNQRHMLFLDTAAGVWRLCRDEMRHEIVSILLVNPPAGALTKDCNRGRTVMPMLNDLICPN